MATGGDKTAVGGAAGDVFNEDGQISLVKLETIIGQFGESV